MEGFDSYIDGYRSCQNRSSFQHRSCCVLFLIARCPLDDSLMHTSPLRYVADPCSSQSSRSMNVSTRLFLSTEFALLNAFPPSPKQLPPSQSSPQTALTLLSSLLILAFCSPCSTFSVLHAHPSAKAQILHLNASSTSTPRVALSPLHHPISSRT